MVNKQGHRIHQSDDQLWDFYCFLDGVPTCDTQRELCPCRTHREEQAVQGSLVLKLPT